jgi:hypothetical protein
VALIPGNLLSYNHQSVETSIGNWADFANGATSVVQGSGTALEGTKSILSTRNATAGDVAMGGITTTGQVPVVTPGTTYVYSFWVFTAVAGTVWHAQNDWYQSNNTTFISTVTGPDITVPANTWTEIRSTQTAPALAGVARLFLQLRSGLASTQTANIDQVFFGFPVVAEPNRELLPSDDPFRFDSWMGAPDASHDVIVNAGTASITFLSPATQPMMLLALTSESGPGATAITSDDPYVIMPALLTPDDVTGGMQPWGGAPDSIIVTATVASAGVASMSFTAQSASAGLAALPAPGSITLAANGATAAVSSLPGTATVAFTGRSATAGLGATPGTAAVSFAAQSASAGLAALPAPGSITFTGRSALAGPGGAAGVASVSLSAGAPVAGLAALPSSSSIVFTAQQASVPGTVVASAGVASISFTARGPAPGLGALPSAASVAFTGWSATGALAVLPSAAAVTVAARGAAVVLPQVGTPTLISGNEPQGALHGRESISSASGSDTGLISGRQPLSSTSGTEAPTSLKGRES